MIDLIYISFIVDVFYAVIIAFLETRFSDSTNRRHT